MFLLLAFVSLALAAGHAGDAVHWEEHSLTLTEGAALRGGLSGIVANWNWRTRNVTALYVGSEEHLYKFDLETHKLTPVLDVQGGVHALAWAKKSPEAESLGGDNQLYIGSKHTGQVWTIENADGQLRGTDLTPLGKQRLVGLESLAVTQHNAHLHATTCDHSSDALWHYDASFIRQEFCKINQGYGCLGQVDFHYDNTLFGVSECDRTVVRVYSGKAVKIAQLPEGKVPVGVVLDSKANLYVGVNDVTKNQRQAEIHYLDMKTGELTLMGAVGGAVLDSFTVSRDDRVFLVDSAHTAIHELQFSKFLHQELKLINSGRLTSGAKHAGGAGAKTPFGHAAWRSTMLFGAETLSYGGGVSTWSTPDGTEMALVADSKQFKSLTAKKFVDTWPLPGSKDKCMRLLKVHNVHVPQLFEGEERSFERPVLATNWEDGEVYQFSPFACHLGDLDCQSSWSSGFQTPYGVVQAKTGTILVADFSTGEIRQTDGFVVASGLEGPVGLALADETGKTLYVTEWNAGRVTEVHVDTKLTRVLMEGLHHPEGIAVNPLNGHIVVIETNGDRRLLSFDPADTAAEPVVIARDLPGGKVNSGLGENHPYLMNGVDFGDVVGSEEPGSRRSVSLYVSLDGDASVRCYKASQMIEDPNNPCNLGVGVKLPVHTERDGRDVATISLFHPTVPAHVAVPQGTWLRFKAFRINELHHGKNAPAGARWLESESIPGFHTTWLFPRSSLNKEGKLEMEPRGSPTYELLLNTTGKYTYRDVVHNAEGMVTVYDPVYDDKENDKFCPDATLAPTPAPTDAPPCRKAETVDCPPGYKLDAIASAEGCLTSIRCIPEGYSYLKYPSSMPDGSHPNIHSGRAPYVPDSWRVGDEIERPNWPGNAYPWKAWREWWQTARPGTADASQYWYAPQHRHVAPVSDDPDDQWFDGVPGIGC